MSDRPQDIFQLPFRITEFNADMLIQLDRNFKEIERLLGNSQLYEKLVGKPNDEKVEAVSSYIEFADDGFKVFDGDEKLRAHLGQYGENEFGLLIQDHAGARIIDAKGAMQTWQEGRTDNVDVNYGLSLFLYIPKETREIKKCILRMRLLDFRSYGSASKDGGAVTVTSEEASSIEQTSSSGGSINQSSDDGGDETSGSSNEKSTVSDPGSTVTSRDTWWSLDPGRLPDATSWEGGHNHGLTDHDHGNANNMAQGSHYGNHIHSLDWAHEHDVEIPAHDHGMDHTHLGPLHSHWISVNSHSHSVQIPAHDHDVYVPFHKHDIDHGIHMGTSPGSVGIYINGIDRTSELGGPWTVSQSNIDISDYILIDHWNEVEIGSDQLGRIDATVFVQAMIDTS